VWKWCTSFERENKVFLKTKGAKPNRTPTGKEREKRTYYPLGAKIRVFTILE